MLLMTASALASKQTSGTPAARTRPVQVQSLEIPPDNNLRRIAMHGEHTSVLAVGGGLTGLSAAAFLAWHGTPCLLVERRPDLLIHPRARGFTRRTVESYRQ